MDLTLFEDLELSQETLAKVDAIEAEFTAHANRSSAAFRSGPHSSIQGRPRPAGGRRRPAEIYSDWRRWRNGRRDTLEDPRGPVPSLTDESPALDYWLARFITEVGDQDTSTSYTAGNYQPFLSYEVSPLC